jgi:MFS family permease
VQLTRAALSASFQPRQMVSSLRQRNYRLFFSGQLISVAGTWMQTVAQSFLVLDLTRSGTQLGLATAARFLPIFLFGPMGGLLADRMDKRRVLLVTQTLSGLLAGVFAVLTATGTINMAIVYVLAVALGFVNVFDNPARQSFISEMVSAEDLANAVTLNSVSMNMARVFGAALGGVIAAALGLALCFAANAISFGAVLVSLLLMRRSELFPARRVPRRKRQVREGLSYVRRTPELLVPLLLIAVVGTLAWEFNVTLPLMASKVFHGGAAAYGIMASVMGAREPGPCAWPRSAGASPSWPPRSPPASRSSWPRWCSSATAASPSTHWPRPPSSSRPPRPCAAGSWPCGAWPGSAPPPSAARSSAGSPRSQAPAGPWSSAASPPWPAA